MWGAPWPAFCLLLCLLPPAAGKTLRYHIYEEEPPGTVIGTLADDLPAEPPGERTFRLLKPPGNGSLVRVRERDGQLSLGPERLDREALCGASSAWCALSFDVVCLGGAGSSSPYQVLQVELEVRDVNDHAPRFPQAEVSLEVSEAALPGTRLPLGLALDPDAGANGVQSFALSPNRHFGLEAPRRADGLKGAELVLLAPLDREAQASFRLELVAKDGGSPARSGTATLALRVLDANDNAPAFPRGGAPRLLELPEDAPPGALLLELGAADPDEGANGALLYAWGSQVGAEARALFALDPLSGRLSLRAALDYERQRAFELDVQASDRGASPLRAACKVLVRLLDVNDNAPQIDLRPLRSRAQEEGDGGEGEERGPDGEDVAYVSEAAPPGSLVALVSVWDRDSGANGQVSLSLVSPEGGKEGTPPPFTLRPAHEEDDDEEEEDEQGQEEGQEPGKERGRSFLLLTSGPLDRERVPEYNLTLLAQDRGSPPARSTRRLSVRLADENDHAPRFASPALRLPLPENNPPGAFLAALAARDPDLGPNGRVAYRLLLDDQGGQQQLQLRGAPLATYVSLDAASGALYALRSFDYEALKELALTVVATDGGNPPLSSAAQVTIRVLDLNDNAPVITHPAPRNGSLEVWVSRRAARGAQVGRIQARDADEGENAALSFALLPDPGAQDEEEAAGEALALFAVDAESGALVLTGSLAGEPPGKVFRALLRVSDGGRPSLSATAALRFILTSSEEEPASSSSSGASWEAAAPSPSSSSSALHWDGPLIVIAVLAGSCTLLLVAIIAIATSCNRRKRQKQLQERLKQQQRQGNVLEEPIDDGGTGGGSRSSSPGRRNGGAGGAGGGGSSSSPGTRGGGGVGVSFEVRSFASKSSFASAEPSPASEDPPPSEGSRSESASLYDSSQGRLRPAHAHESYASTPSYSKETAPPPVPIWKGHSFNTISGREGDKFSGKDSGKGDSDFNDSDSDISGDALKRDLITHMQNGLWACTAECKILGHSDRCWSPSCGRTNPHCASHPKTQLSTFCKSTSLPRDSIRRDNYYQAQLPKTVGLQSVYEKVLHRDYDRTMTLLSPPHPGRLPDLQEISVPLYQAPSTRYLGPPPETNQNG
ncbi:protocadherin-8 [Anolis sagrei]|uniref:protocadherin-8 n=1 Tax=Anolis sagrei TaxID=38937 RepID=UPI003522D71C